VTDETVPPPPLPEPAPMPDEEADMEARYRRLHRAATVMATALQKAQPALSGDLPAEDTLAAYDAVTDALEAWEALPS
jgi:hypothetical protein